MWMINIWLYMVICFISRTKVCVAQIFVGQSDRYFIQRQDKVQTNAVITSFRDFTVDISSANFKKQPQILYALKGYNSDTTQIDQGFLITTVSSDLTFVEYRIHSLGPTLFSLPFILFAIDDPNVEIRSQQLVTAGQHYITGREKITQISAYFNGFNARSFTILDLRHTFTRQNDTCFTLDFQSQYIQDVFIQFVIVYQQNNNDIFEQLYSYEYVADNRDSSISTPVNVVWNSPTVIEQAIVLDGVKDFSVSSGLRFGFEIAGGGSASNKVYIAAYNKLSDAIVNFINGQFQGFLLKTCRPNQFMNLNSTYHSCVTSCTPGKSSTVQLYNSYVTVCYECDLVCLKCVTNSPSTCTDCYTGYYLNPVTKTCQNTQPPGSICTPTTVSGETYFNCMQCEGLYYNPATTSCQSTKPTGTICTPKVVNGGTYYDCQQCHITCLECSAANSSTSCTICDPSYQYFYQNKCQSTLPTDPDVYCDNKFVCLQCHQNCTSCQNTSTYCLSCKPPKYLYQNQCLDLFPIGTFCQQKQ